MQYKKGDLIGDFMILKFTERKNNSNYYLVRCIVCGHVKEIGENNMKKQNMIHSKLNCKIDFYKELIGKTFSDYTLIGIKEDAGFINAVVKCNVCGNVNEYRASEIFRLKLNHNASRCGLNYYLNEIGKTYGDYNIIEYVGLRKTYHMYKVKCMVCGTEGYRSLGAIKKSIFKHGAECFKMISGKYKKIFAQRFYCMNNRCNNPNCKEYRFYGAKGIKLEYSYVIDFYLDFIDEFKEHVRVHGLKESTFDRINPFGNYSKDNLRVATRKIQDINKRTHQYFVVQKGDMLVLSDDIMCFAEKYKINGRSLGNMLRGVSKSAGGWKLIAKSKDVNDLKDINVTTKLITEPSCVI